MAATSNAPRTKGRIRTVGLLVLAISLAGVIGAGTVWARSVGAFSGRSIDNNLPSCFSEEAGGVRGTGLGAGGNSGGCSTPFSDSPRWEVSLPVDSAGTWTVSAGMMGTGTSGPFCRAYAVNQVSGIVATSSRVQQTGASYQVFSLTGTPGINVPAGGYLFVACDTILLNHRVGSINWTTP